MTKIERKAEDFGQRTERGNATFTIHQIIDVCELLKAKQFPDGKFSDDECSLWSVIRQEFQMYDF